LGGLVDQGEGEHQEVADDPINCHFKTEYFAEALQ
jgi:hypothetical protein